MAGVGVGDAIKTVLRKSWRSVLQNTLIGPCVKASEDQKSFRSRGSVCLTIFVHIGFLCGYRGHLHHGGPLFKARLCSGLLPTNHAVVHAAGAEAWNGEAHFRSFFFFKSVSSINNQEIWGRTHKWLHSSLKDQFTWSFLHLETGVLIQNVGLGSCLLQKGQLCSGMKTRMMSSNEHLRAHVHSRYLFSSGLWQTECGTSSSPAETDVHTTNQHGATAALKLW